MASRSAVILLVAASLGLLACPAAAQTAEAPTPRSAPALAARPAAKPRKAKAHVAKAAKPSSGAAAGPAADPAPDSNGETEAASLERRRKAFFAAKPAEATPDADTPPVGVTLGGSGGLSPGMGFKF